jgi:hypothetical protein
MPACDLFLAQKTENECRCYCRLCLRTKTEQEARASSTILTMTSTEETPTTAVDQGNMEATSTNQEAAASVSVSPSISKNETTLEESTTEEDADTVFFGSLNGRIADAFADRIQASLSEGVKSLPLLSENTKGDALLEKLQKSYLKNVDIVEAYGERNLFTLQMYPPKRRQRITRAFLERDHESEKPKTSTTTTTTQLENSSYQYPTEEQIPSQEQSQSLQDEVQALRAQLQAARLRRNTLLIANKTKEVAQQATEQVSTSLPLQELETIHTSVTAAVMGGQGLEQLQEQGKQALNKLEDSKRERSTPEDDEEEEELLAPPSKKRVSLEEHYREQRRMVDTNLDSLAAVRNLLRR